MNKSNKSSAYSKRKLLACGEKRGFGSEEAVCLSLPTHTLYVPKSEETALSLIIEKAVFQTQNKKSYAPPSSGRERCVHHLLGNSSPLHLWSPVSGLLR